MDAKKFRNQSASFFTIFLFLIGQMAVSAIALADSPTFDEFYSDVQRFGSTRQASGDLNVIGSGNQIGGNQSLGGGQTLQEVGDDDTPVLDLGEKPQITHNMVFGEKGGINAYGANTGRMIIEQWLDEKGNINGIGKIQVQPGAEEWSKRVLPDPARELPGGLEPGFGESRQNDLYQPPLANPFLEDPVQDGTFLTIAEFNIIGDLDIQEWTDQNYSGGGANYVYVDPYDHTQIGFLTDSGGYVSFHQQENSQETTGNFRYTEVGIETDLCMLCNRETTYELDHYADGVDRPFARTEDVLLYDNSKEGETVLWFDRDVDGAFDGTQLNIDKNGDGKPNHFWSYDTALRREDLFTKMPLYYNHLMWNTSSAGYLNLHVSSGDSSVCDDCYNVRGALGSVDYEYYAKDINENETMFWRNTDRDLDWIPWRTDHEPVPTRGSLDTTYLLKYDDQGNALEQWGYDGFRTRDEIYVSDYQDITSINLNDLTLVHPEQYVSFGRGSAFRQINNGEHLTKVDSFNAY